LDIQLLKMLKSGILVIMFIGESQCAHLTFVGSGDYLASFYLIIIFDLLKNITCLPINGNSV